MTPSTKRLMFALTLIGGSAAIAYGVGRSMRELPAANAARWQQGASATAPGMSGEDHPTAGTASTSPASAPPKERAKKVASIKQRLRELWRAAPAIVADWEAERETQALLKQLDTAELAAFLRETKTDGGSLANYHIRYRLSEALATQDGPAALEESMTYLADSLSPVRTFGHWAKHDPDAALTWLRDAKLSPALEEMKSSMRINFLSDLAEKDFTRAIAELPYMDAAEKRWFFNSLGSIAAKDEAKNAALKELVATHDPSAALEIEKSKVSTLASKDPAAALDHIASLDLPAEQKAELEIAQLRSASAKSMTEAFDGWLARHEDTAPIPDSMWPALESSFIFRNEETLKWLDTLPAGATRDAFYQRGVRLLAARHDFAKAADYTATIEDPAARELTMKRLHSMWTEANPDAAKSWQESLPESDRQHLD